LKRRRLSTQDRAKVFDASYGICHMCGLKIDAGQEWEASHRIPLACGGADDMSNISPAHRRCHRTHTAQVDAPLIAKVRRQHQNHIGAKTTARPIPSRGFAPTERTSKRLSESKRVNLPPAFARQIREIKHD
jgi:5-methylcytosine-specific restriction protein A